MDHQGTPQVDDLKARLHMAILQLLRMYLLHSSNMQILKKNFSNSIIVSDGTHVLEANSDFIRLYKNETITFFFSPGLNFLLYAFERVQNF